MFCTKCGKELADHAKFCSDCGTQVPELKEEPNTASCEETPIEGAPTTKSKKKLSALALAGFIVSMASILLFPLAGGIVGLILSRKGKAEIEAQDLDGQGFATAGIVVGVVNIIRGIIQIIIVIALIVGMLAGLSSLM